MTPKKYKKYDSEIFSLIKNIPTISVRHAKSSAQDKKLKCFKFALLTFSH
jgi:hypothetical protein